MRRSKCIAWDPLYSNYVFAYIVCFYSVDLLIQPRYLGYLFTGNLFQGPENIETSDPLRSSPKCGFYPADAAQPSDGYHDTAMFDAVGAFLAAPLAAG